MKQNVNCIIPPAHPPTPVHFTSKRLQISLFGSVCAFLARPFAACFSLVTLLLWPLWRKGVTGNVGSFKLERLDVKLLIKHFFPLLSFYCASSGRAFCWCSQKHKEENNRERSSQNNTESDSVYCCALYLDLVTCFWKTKHNLYNERVSEVAVIKTVCTFSAF